MRATTVCAWGFYYAGDLVSKLMPYPDVGWRFMLYQWLMRWSDRLDTEEKVWTTVEWELPESED